VDYKDKRKQIDKRKDFVLIYIDYMLVEKESWRGRKENQMQNNELICIWMVVLYIRVVWSFHTKLKIKLTQDVNNNFLKNGDKAKNN